MHAIPNHESFVLIAAVPAEKRFDHISVKNNQPGCQHHLRHVVHVAHRNETFQAVNLSQRNRQQEHHRKACIDSPGHKVRRKDRRVPTGNNADSEVEADNRVHGKHERRCQSREQQIRRFIAMPVTRRSPPAHGQHAVDNSEWFAVSAIAQRREIGNQTDEPEKGRHGRVSRHREDVPHQRAAELWPDAHRVRIREQPVSQPRPPEVHDWIHAGLRDGE